MLSFALGRGRVSFVVTLGHGQDGGEEEGEEEELDVLEQHDDFCFFFLSVL